jgi:hypothetical protein
VCCFSCGHTHTHAHGYTDGKQLQATCEAAGLSLTAIGPHESKGWDGLYKELKGNATRVAQAKLLQLYQRYSDMSTLPFSIRAAEKSGYLHACLWSVGGFGARVKGQVGVQLPAVSTGLSKSDQQGFVLLANLLRPFVPTIHEAIVIGGSWASAMSIGSALVGIQRVYCMEVERKQTDEVPICCTCVCVSGIVACVSWPLSLCSCLFLCLCCVALRGLMLSLSF